MCPFSFLNFQFFTNYNTECEKRCRNNRRKNTINTECADEEFLDIDEVEGREEAESGCDSQKFRDKKC